jgi:hypothetical protein
MRPLPPIRDGRTGCEESYPHKGEPERQPRTPGGFKLGPMVKLTAPYYVREFKKQKSERFPALATPEGGFLLRGKSDPLRTCAARYARRAQGGCGRQAQPAYQTYLHQKTKGELRRFLADPRPQAAGSRPSPPPGLVSEAKYMS